MGTRAAWIPLVGFALAAACGRGPVATPVNRATVTAPSQGKLTLPPAGRLYHGVLPSGVDQPDSDISPANLDAYEATVDRKVAYVYFTNNWFQTKAFPTGTAQWIRSRGAIPFIRLSIRSQFKTTVTDPTYTLDRLAAGEFDKDLAAWADGAAAFGTPLVVEYGTEINGDWFPWSAPYNGGLGVGPAKFKTVYRHIHDVMVARGATNITWALHYNVQDFPVDPRNTPAAYYPGDDVVDWVGVSAYGSERPYDNRCPSFAQLVDAMLPELQAATTQKPLFIFEFGITGGNPRCDAGPWVQAALDDLLGGRWPMIKGFSWWNERWHNGGGPDRDSDMLVQEVAPIGNAFRAAFQSPAGAAVVDAPIFEKGH